MTCRRKEEEVYEGMLLWEPSDERKAQANITRYMRWLKETRGLDFNSYDDLWQWSVTQLEDFWASQWEFWGVKAYRPYTQVLSERRMPGARWFLGAELNFAEHALRRRDEHPAVVFRSEDRPFTTLTYAELFGQVAAVASALRRMGVQRGDRVVAYMPNIPQTIVAFLATASLGAVWATCSPDFGVRSTVDRFRQIEPQVLFAVDGYQYNGRLFDRIGVLREIQNELPSLCKTVLVPYLKEKPSTEGLKNVVWWNELLSERPSELIFEPVPFDHPLWVLYSSGTTGLPKAIVHGHGGILIELLKALGLHIDLKPEDRFFWYTNTGWVMWNLAVVGGLLHGATVVIYDGSVGYPDLRTLWRLAEEARLTFFGTSGPFIETCRRTGLSPGREFDLTHLKSIGYTGAPCSPEGFKWVYDHVKKDVLLGSASGGTDVCTGFVGSCPLLPVHAGETQCRCLGVKVEAYNEQGQSVVEEVGEMVITEPMPSMPLFLWNDPDGSRYRESYFEMFPGVWQHGDWIKITKRGSCVIYGRSDSTIKRAGVRLGASDFYRVVEEMPEVTDSLVVDTSLLGSEGKVFLFVVLKEGVTLDEELKQQIRERLRREVSPRHVPDEIYAIPEVPRTLNFKKLEVPVRKILLGTPEEKAVNRDAMMNPQSIDWFIQFARSLQSKALY